MPDQQLRHKVILKHGAMFDAILVGGYRWIPEKIEGLGENRYSLATENCHQNYYFSKKLIDGLPSGNVPIYWGCPSIGLFFDQGGIISFGRPRELGPILESIGPENYERRLPVVNRNLSLAKCFACPEVHVWENVRDLFAEARRM